MFPTAAGPLSGSFALEHTSYSPESGGVYKLGKRALVSSCRSCKDIEKDRSRYRLHAVSTLLATGFQALINSYPLEPNHSTCILPIQLSPPPFQTDTAAVV